MRAIKAHMLICGVILTIAISVLSVDPSKREISPTTMANVIIEEEGKSAVNATAYFDEQKRVRLDIDLWGESMITEIYRDGSMYSICGERCDIMGEVSSPIHLFAVPANFEKNGTVENCEIFTGGDSFSCDILRYDVGEDLVGYGYANDQEQIIAIEIKRIDGSLLRRTIFKSSETIENDVFGPPEYCTCKGSICFLLDGSESVSKADFVSIKHTIIDAINSASNQNIELQLSASQFATLSYPISGVTADKEAFIKSLEETVQEGGLTDIQSGLHECFNYFEESELLGPPSIVIITDGNYTNHPSLNGDPRSYASQIRAVGIEIQAGPIRSPRFLDEDLIGDIVTNNSTFDKDNAQDIYDKVIESKCQRSLCENYDCDKGYCVCGGCVCPPGSEGDGCRSSNNIPEVRVPSSGPDGDRSEDSDNESSNVGAIVGGVLGAFAGAALIGLLAFAAVKHFGGAGAAAAGSGGGGQMSGDPNPLYEQQGVGGENPLHGGD